MMGMPQIRAALFDMDGTLLDSNDAHALCYQKAFREAGYFFDYLRIRRLIGMGGDHLVPTLAGFGERSPEGRRIAERKQKLFMEDAFPHLRPLPGARELIEAIHRRGVRIAIASSGRKEELDCFLRIIGIERWVDFGTTADDASSSKPDPEIVVAALRRLKLAPQFAVMVGDTPYDITAATRAGVPCIALRTGGWTDEDLRGASIILQDPFEMLARLDSLPYFWNRPDLGERLLGNL